MSTPEVPRARPEGVSEADWRLYEEARKLMPGFEAEKGGISKAAALIHHQSGRLKDGARRGLHRVLKALRKNS
jgi:hypothetical protein